MIESFRQSAAVWQMIFNRTSRLCLLFAVQNEDKTIFLIIISIHDFSYQFEWFETADAASTMCIVAIQQKNIVQLLIAYCVYTDELMEINCPIENEAISLIDSNFK